MMISVQLYPIRDATGLDGASIALNSLDPAKDQDLVESLDILGSNPPQTPQAKRLLEKDSSRVCLCKAVQSLSKGLTFPEILQNLEKDERGKPFFVISLLISA